MTLNHAIAVMAGGAIGTLARFALREWLPTNKDAFPWATFIANLLGSFILGIVVVACKDRPTFALLLGVGFCGGFTTFSTFSLELLQMIESKQLGLAIVYLLGSVVAGLAGVYLGLKVIAT